jgi:hypothetical protein
MSSGTLTYWENHIPKEGERVFIFVCGKGFPSGVWKGVLTHVGDIGESHIVPIEEMGEYHTRCIAEIADDRATICRNKEPIGDYEVFPEAPGMEQMLNKLFEQKAEVKALKKAIEITKKTVRDIFQNKILP